MCQNLIRRESYTTFMNPEQLIEFLDNLAKAEHPTAVVFRVPSFPNMSGFIRFERDYMNDVTAQDVRDLVDYIRTLKK